uniref:Uma2 domain-containing protein n=1 Tax=Heterorhabditis bacteriophora TaxID=37862 RepID=A0A1I7XES9_HETBA
MPMHDTFTSREIRDYDSNRRFAAPIAVVCIEQQADYDCDPVSRPLDTKEDLTLTIEIYIITI